MCKRIVCLVLFIFAIGVIDTVQAATVFLEDFEGPPAPSGTTALADDLGWTKSGAGVGYNTTVPYLDTGAAHQPAANSHHHKACLLYTSPSPRDGLLSRMPSSA